MDLDNIYPASATAPTLPSIITVGDRGSGGAPTTTLASSGIGCQMGVTTIPVTLGHQGQQGHGGQQVNFQEKYTVINPKSHLLQRTGSTIRGETARGQSSGSWANDVTGWQGWEADTLGGPGYHREYYHLHANLFSAR